MAVSVEDSFGCSVAAGDGARSALDGGGALTVSRVHSASGAEELGALGAAQPNAITSQLSLWSKPVRIIIVPFEGVVTGIWTLSSMCERSPRLLVCPIRLMGPPTFHSC